ncbi:MAG: GNAT family N-acetyltransferase [Boseongicola sp.]
MQNECVSLRDMQPGDLDWLVERQRVLYAASDGFNETFGDLVENILQDFLATRDPAHDRAWIAVADDQRLGSVFCARTETSGIAQLRLLFTEPEARGLGLGQRLLSACVDFARLSGNHTLRLWTHDTHQSAIRLYERNGFKMMASEPVCHFGQNREQQHWELQLA